MKPKTEIRVLNCTLTDKEKQRYGDQLAELIGVRESLREEHKAASALLRERFKGLDEEIEKLCCAIRTGAELRDVTCQAEVLGSTYMAIRTDTGETVEERNATSSERQTELEV